jgi:plastocyanin
MRFLASLAFAAALVASPVLAADHAVAIKGMKFDPPSISVAVGDTITFTNEDSAPHTATALDGAFDTGRLNKGQSAQVKISAAGDAPYKCLIHPSMKGTVAAK